MNQPSLLHKFKNRWYFYSRQIRQNLIRMQWRGIRDRSFTIISNNCIGGRVYEELGVMYRTPTVGLMFYARDFVLFAANLRHYIDMPLTFTEVSRYASANQRKQETPYPIGVLDDVEVHFWHYASEQEALEKWERRKQRINWERLYFLFTDQEECTLADLEAFDRLPHPHKVCFVAGSYPHLKSCVTIRAYAGRKMVGNLYTHYELFLGSFNFARWLNQ